MKKTNCKTSSFFVLCLSVIIALAMIPKTDAFSAEFNDSYEAIAFGNTKSNVEVYIITDWFCSTCSDLEPLFEALYPYITKKAALYFVDRAIHPQTMNFVPYNLSFLHNNKQKYFAIRKSLHKLAKKTKTPTEEDVAGAMAPLGVHFQPLSYADVDAGIKFFDGITRTFNINETPTILIINRNHKLDARKFTGNDQITRERVLKVVKEFTKNNK